MRCIAFAFLLAGLAVLASGCIFSPDKGDGGGGGGGGTPQYKKLDSPEHVLENLSLSYAARDSNEYKTLYDSTYVGTSQDLNDPPGTQVSTFRYADEVAHVAALQRATTITSVFFDIGNNTTWHRLSSSDPSHPEWADYTINSTHIEIYDGTTLYVVQSNSPVTFSFIPTVKAPGDTLWKIVRWVEVGNSGA